MSLIRLMLTRALVLLLLFGVASTGVATAQEPQPPDDDQEQTADGDDAEEDDADGPGRGRDKDGIKPYDEVITDEAETDEGVFTVHQLDDKVFYEIPEAELGTEFLWVSQIARTTQGVGYGGQSLGNRVVTWERRGDKVLLKSVSYAVVADDWQKQIEFALARSTQFTMPVAPTYTANAVDRASANSICFCQSSPG